MISKNIKGKIYIESISSDSDGTNKIVQTEECTIFEKSGEIFIFYDESEDTLASDVKSKIKISDDSVNIVRKGTYHSNILFKEGYTCNFRYCMPYGDIDMSVKTDIVKVVNDEKNINISLEYMLNNGEADIKSTMNIKIEKVI